MIQNTSCIDSITIETSAHSFCPLGQDVYTNKFIIDFFPDDFIPDYCVFDEWIANHIEGQTLTVEDAVDRLHSYLMKTYRPAQLSISSTVEDGGHCKVTVRKDKW